MILKKIIVIFILSNVILSCAEYKVQKKKLEKKYYSSSGFALIYDDDLYKEKVITKKINNNDIAVIHNLLKPKTSIIITNPENSKVVKTMVTKKANYPSIFNIVISKKIVEELELDIETPFLEVVEIKKNKTFIAKKSNTFDEEKNVAEKAPVDEILMNDLSKEKKIIKKKSKKNYKFILVISDFYYRDSAENLMSDLIKKTETNNFSIKKINNKKYRLFLGPFKNFNALKTAYISLNNLGFENLNIYKE